eukprot:tig00000248_g21831.t1
MPNANATPARNNTRISTRTLNVDKYMHKLRQICTGAHAQTRAALQTTSNHSAAACERDPRDCAFRPPSPSPSTGDDSDVDRDVICLESSSSSAGSSRRTSVASGSACTDNDSDREGLSPLRSARSDPSSSLPRLPTAPASGSAAAHVSRLSIPRPNSCPEIAVVDSSGSKLKSPRSSGAVMPPKSFGEGFLKPASRSLSAEGTQPAQSPSECACPDSKQGSIAATYYNEKHDQLESLLSCVSKSQIVDQLWDAVVAVDTTMAAKRKAAPSTFSLLRSLPKPSALEAPAIEGAPGPSRTTSVTYTAYEAFHMALHRAIFSPRATWDLDDGKKLAQANWTIDTDACGGTQMSREAFDRAVLNVSKFWAAQLESSGVVTGMRLLAADAGLPAAAAASRGLELVFLACFTAAVTKSASTSHARETSCASSSASNPVIRSWFEVKLGVCQPKGVMSTLQKLIEARRARCVRCRAGYPNVNTPGRGRSSSSLGTPVAPVCAEKSSSEPCMELERAASAPVLASAGAGPCSPSEGLLRFALHNRMEKILEQRRRASSQSL